MKFFIILLILPVLSGCNRFDSSDILSEDNAWTCISSNRYDHFYQESCEGRSVELTSFVKQRKNNYLILDRYMSVDPSYDNDFEFEAKTDSYWQPGDKVKLQGVLDNGDVDVHAIHYLPKSVTETEQFKIWARKEKIEKLFSAWDGSQPNVVRQVMLSLKDPDSFEHISTKYIDNGDHITVIMQYRAKNSFGASVPAVAIAQVTENGSVQDITNSQ